VALVVCCNSRELQDTPTRITAENLTLIDGYPNEIDNFHGGVDSILPLHVYTTTRRETFLRSW